MTYVEAIRLALRSALDEDDRVVVLGEDVGGGGGAFRATAGLQEEFGAQRVIDTPISEAAFTGAAVGMALDGMRPVVEFQFSDFLTSGMNAIVNTAAKMHFRHGQAVPLVIRAPGRGRLLGRSLPLAEPRGLVPPHPRAQGRLSRPPPRTRGCCSAPRSTTRTRSSSSSRRASTRA